MSEPHLDETVQTGLREVMEDGYSQLLESYFQDSAERLRDIHAALAASDCSALLLAAHSFKGSSGNLGAPRLVELLRQLEDHARRQNLAAARSLVEQVEQEFAIVRDLLAARQAPDS